MTLPRRLVLIAVGAVVATLALLAGLPGVLDGALPTALAPSATPQAATHTSMVAATHTFVPVATRAVVATATRTSVPTPSVVPPAATATPLPPTPTAIPSAVSHVDLAATDPRFGIDEAYLQPDQADDLGARWSRIPFIWDYIQHDSPTSWNSFALGSQGTDAVVN